MGAHPRADHRDLADPVVVEQRLEAHLLLQLAQRGHGRLAILSRQGERDVGAAGRGSGNVLHDHVDVDGRAGDDTEDPRRLADLVRHAHDSDLRFAPVVRDSGDDRLFHPAVLRLLPRHAGDPGAFPATER